MAPGLDSEVAVAVLAQTVGEDLGEDAVEVEAADVLIGLRGGSLGEICLPVTVNVKTMPAPLALQYLHALIHLLFIAFLHVRSIALRFSS